MSNRHYPGSYSGPYQPKSGYNQNIYEQTGKIGKQRNSYDIKQSNISQQTIIHRARLYSPDKSQEFARYNSKKNQNWGKTKAKRSQITAKIHQIVDLCEDDREAQIQEFQEVVEAEKKILDMLRKSQVAEQEVPSIHLTNFQQINQDRGTTFGPIRTQAQNPQKNKPKQLPQPFIPSPAPNNTITRQNIYKKSAIDDLKTDRNNEDMQSSLPAEIKQITQINKPLNDETQKMIEEIQRKAMEEIQGLRNDKIELMRKLNQEIRAHNQEKKIRIRLENQLARLRGQQIPKRGQYSQSSQEQLEMQANPRPQKNFSSQPPIIQKQRNNSFPSQTYYPPQVAPPSMQYPHPYSQQYSHPYPQAHPNTGMARQSQQAYPMASQPRKQSLTSYENQIQRLQQENSNLMKTLRNNSTHLNANVNSTKKSNQKQGLKFQVLQLNQLVQQYEGQLGKGRVQSNMQGISQLESLLEQGERIQLQALRLLNRNSQQTGRRVPTSQQLVDQANNFKRSLFASEYNRQSNKQINANNRNSYENLPGPGTRNSYESNRIQQFERILNDMNNAAR